jgi:hypothetical protein
VTAYWPPGSQEAGGQCADEVVQLFCVKVTTTEPPSVKISLRRTCRHRSAAQCAALSGLVRDLRHGIGGLIPHRLVVCRLTLLS